MTQRERLVNAMIELCADVGYQNASIAQVSSRAGVSSATFYAQFNDKEACLLAAYRASAKRLLGEIRPLVDARDWSRGARGVLRRLLGAAREQPAAGRFLLVEARAAGPRVRDQRQRALEAFEAAIDHRLDHAQEGEQTLDIPAQALIGGLRGLIVRDLQTRREDDLPLLEDHLVGWLGAYATSASGPRFSTGPSAVQSGPVWTAPAPIEDPVARLPRGRHGLPPGVVARSRRTRLIYATADVTMRKGYANTTVADIVATAGVAREVFYEHFSDKQHAFLEAQQHPTQHILDECANAYFTAGAWPSRVWSALRTLIGLIVANHAISHLRLVECYAAGPAAIRRAEEITRSFTVFVEEGYGYRPAGRDLPRLYSYAIAGAIFEIVQRHIARRDPEALQRALPQLVYIVIAPFTGPAEAARLVQEMSVRTARATRP